VVGPIPASQRDELAEMLRMMTVGVERTVD
jgi:hypothetical protein